jgi:hypothetical protein
MRRAKRAFWIARSGSDLASLVLRLRLLEPETYKNGPFANVVYMDNVEPWAEFIFKYKSYGKSPEGLI